MKTNKILQASGTAIALGALGFYAYSVFAVQGAGTLAQAPMNIQATTPPAFIMAVDNSGSMLTDQTLFRTDSGVGYFCNQSGRRGLFKANGKPNEAGDCGGATTVAEAVDTNGIQRTDMYGAARDPEYNRAYYNPATIYLPWRRADGTYEPNSPVNAALEDPRTQYGGTTFDFTTTKSTSATFPSGTILTAGTEYYTSDNGCGLTKNSWTVASADVTMPKDCAIAFKYYPAQVYLSTGAAAPPGFDTSKRVLVKGAGPQGADLYRYDFASGNFASTAAYDSALQNFANYWTYYGNRNRAMISAMTQSMADVTNMRVGYFTINPTPPSGNVTMYNIDTPADRDALYVKMRALWGNNATPTRTATAYMIEQFRRTDSGAPVQLVCQKNAGMLFTDGYTNESNSGGFNVGDTDSSLPAPFGGGVASSNTIADFAADGYYTNLRPDLPAGKVPVPGACSSATPDPRLDCNKNLHVNFYGVTLGSRGKVYDVDPAATADPYANPPAWAALGTTKLQPENVDDIWHASLTSRGEFINAQSPAAITEAMRRILVSVGAGTTPSGTLALTGSRVGTGSLTVVPGYTATNNSTDWYSTLVGERVSSDPLTGVTYTKVWDASALLPATARSNIWFANAATGVTPTVVPFSASAVTLESLCSDSLASCTQTGSRSIAGKLGITLDQAVAYLMGDASLEVSGSTGKLRSRTTRLGDIVNSTPIVTSAIVDFGYRAIRTVSGPTVTYPYQASYASYLAAKKAADRPMVYVGANDGMLHGFDATTGQEAFAFIPSAVAGHLGNLLFPYDPADKEAQVFRHTYYVDGPIQVSDAYVGGAWKSVLVGTTGAGGRGVFALDVSDPSSFSATSVLWELNDKVTAAASNNGSLKIGDYVGSVLGKPVIVPVRSGSGVAWKAIFGNGYNSISRKAALFVVDLQTGATTIIPAAEAGRDAIANGLGNIVALDRWAGDGSGNDTVRGRDGVADTVYAADQNGALWKFDLRDSSVGATPFFIAEDNAGARQPILGGIEAAAGPGGGTMLYFGTGSFSFNGDKADTQLQSFYAVNDRGGGSVARSDLVRQEITENASGLRQSTANIAGGAGWFIDLGVKSGNSYTQAGERVVGYPRVENGIVFFTTYTPKTTGDCAGDGSNRLYGVASLSGAAAMDQVRVGAIDGTTPAAGANGFALNTGGSAPVKDVVVLSSPGIAPLSPTATPAEQANALASRCSMVVQVAGAPPMYMPRACGRQSWRQVR